jgi:hypothetical protein
MVKPIQLQGFLPTAGIGRAILQRSKGLAILPVKSAAAGKIT